jgi:hypothetical protein
MRGRPAKILKLARGYARNGRADDHLSIIDGTTQGFGEPAGPERSVARFVPAQAGSADGFFQGDRVMLTVPFWGELDLATGVLVKDASGAGSGEPPSYQARSQGTVIYPHPAPDDLLYEMRAKGNYIVMMDDGRKLYSCNSSSQPWVNTELKRIPGQCQVTHRNGQTYVRPKFNALDRVRLKEGFICRNNGRRYEAGWLGRIAPRTISIAESWDSGLYEISLDDDPVRGERGMVTVYAEALVLIRPAPTSRPG